MLLQKDGDKTLIRCTIIDTFGEKRVNRKTVLAVNSIKLNFSFKLRGKRKSRVFAILLC